jgi:hypothetical protein
MFMFILSTRKMNKIIIKDNFLDKSTFNSIKNTIFDSHINSTFPWFLQNHKVKKGDGEMQFTHLLFDNHVINSIYFKDLIPLLKKLKVTALQRMKVNNTIRTNKIRIFGYHTDFENLGRTSIFYLHTTNGPTVFKDGQKVDCVENRMLTFPTNMLHSGSTHTDHLCRGVININWF